MAISKAQLARRCAEKLRLLAPNEPFSAEDLVTIEAEIDTLKDELEARIFGGVTLWTDDAAIPNKIVPGFLLSLLPTVAPHYENVTVSPDSGETGYRELCRQLATPYDSEFSGDEVSSTDGATFNTIAIDGEDSLVAESPRDTLTLVAGSGVSLVTDADDKSLTISAAGAGLGDVSSNTSVSVDSEVVLFSGTGGKTIKRASQTGIAKLSSGVLSVASAETDYLAPTGSAANLTNFPTFNQNTTGTAANVSGTPTLPNGTTATTQSQTDNSTKLATTAYVDTGLGGKQSSLGFTAVPNTRTVNAKALNSDITLTTADIADSSDKRYCTDAQKTVIGNTTGTNSGDQLTFKTVSVSGQSDVVADTATDTLTLEAGSNVTITTNASTDTITIAAAGGGGSAITTKDEGANLTTATASLNFVGGGVVATTAGNDVTVTIAGGGGGDASTNTSSSVDSEVVLFSGAGGKTLKRATGSGIAKLTSGVLSAGTAGTDYSAGTSALSTGILKSTTTTGALTIAIAGDFPTLNQNTSGSSASCTGNAATVTTNANLTGEVTSSGNATTVTNSAVIGKVLTGYTSGAGTVAATDTLLQAIQKLNGNDGALLPATSGTLTTPTIAAGKVTITEGAYFELPAGSADGKFSGTTIAGTAGATLAFGDVVSLDPSNSKWRLADISVADNSTGSARGLIGICVLAGSADAATRVLLNGRVRADANFPTLTINAPVYASTAGDIVVTQPSTTDYVIRVLGFALTADEMYFNPSNDYITHT